MKLFDSHAHYDDPHFDGVRDDVLREVHACCVARITNIGSSLATSRTTLALADRFPFVYAAVGVHPSDAADDMQNSGWLDEIAAMTKHAKVVAIGEIGLDYHYGKDDTAEQAACFRAQMALARDLHLPVVIHDREAHEDTLRVMAEYPEVTGVVHSFSGSFEMAKEVVKRGYYLSVNGVLTFKNARKIVEVVERLDEIGGRDRLLLETDCPYLAPVPHRGETNRSDYMIYTAEKIGELLHMSAEEAAALTYRNACRFYGLPEE